MTDDLVTRLRAAKDGWACERALFTNEDELWTEAADEIERLRLELEVAQSTIWLQGVTNKRLRALITEWAVSRGAAFYSVESSKRPFAAEAALKKEAGQ